MRNHLILVACAASLAWAPFIYAAPEMGHPKSHLGSSDRDGKIYLWYDLLPLTLSDGTKLPLRMRFSAVEQIGSPVFGKFWWCPLLESTLLQKDERSVLFTTLGGRQVLLRKNKDGTYATTDERFRGKMNQPGEMTVEGDGLEYRFSAGRLRGLKVQESGVELEWTYQGSKFLSINVKGGSALVTAEYAGSDPLPKALLAGGTRVEFSSQQVPVVSEVAGQTLVAGYQPSVSEIKRPGITQKFPIQLERGGDYVMAYSSDFWDPQKYMWKAVKGTLLSDGEWTYETVANESPFPTVARKNAKGEVESYYFNSQNGTGKRVNTDGSVVARTYFMSAGPTLNKLRKEVISASNGTVLRETLMSYDEGGRLIRKRWGNYEDAWEWSQDGKLVSEASRFKDEITKKIVYNQDGKIAELQKGGNTYKYAYDEGKTVIQRMVGGQLKDVRVFDGKSPMPLAYVTPENKGSLATPDAPFLNAISPVDRASAAALAEKVIQQSSQYAPQ